MTLWDQAPVRIDIAPMHSDGRTPHLSPACDFVSTIAYFDDKNMALSLARKQKNVGMFDESMWLRFADEPPFLRQRYSNRHGR